MILPLVVWLKSRSEFYEELPVTDLDTAYDQNRNRKVVVKNLIYENDGTIPQLALMPMTWYSFKMDL
jgi:hypothetical protein